MILTDKQFAALSALSARGFEQRLHDHIRVLAADPSLDVPAFAARAIDLGHKKGLAAEDEVAALVEVLLALRAGELGVGIPDWLAAILDDPAPRRAVRLRQCLAVERRVTATGARHG